MILIVSCSKKRFRQLLPALWCVDQHAIEYLLQGTWNNSSKNLFLCWHAIQLVFLPPRSHWGGRGWYTVVLLFYYLCLWPHLIYFNGELWGQITFSTTSTIWYNANWVPISIKELCNQSEIEDSNSNLFRALCNRLKKSYIIASK